jgi:FkbM family methyltransferase
VGEVIEYEYDLQSLELIVPREHKFPMHITPRYRQHYVVNAYEKTTATFLSRLLSSADLFIDVGAHFGFFSLLAADAHPQLPIIALEPTPTTYEILCRNIAMGDRTNIVARQAALSSEPGRKQGFFVSAASDNCSFYEHPNAGPIDRIEVETLSIDSLLSDRTAQRVFIKIDTDGHEFAVLAGMSESLRRGLDIRLVIEFNPKMQRQAGYAPEALLHELDRLGFAMFSIDDAAGRFCRLRPGDDWTSLVDPASYANLYCVAKERALSVAFFAHSSQLAGAERSLIELVDELIADHGAVCTVVAPGPGPLVETVSRSGAATLLAELPWWTLPGDFTRDDVLRSLVRGSQSVCRDLVPALATVDPDIVFTQTLVSPWGALTAAALGKPHVWSVCEFGDRDHGLRFMDRFPDLLAAVKNGSSLILTNSDAMRNAMFEDVGPDRIRTIYRHIPVPDDLTPSTAAWRRETSIKIGLFGSISMGKGQLDAVRAVAELLRRGRDIELLLAGYTVDPDYRARIEASAEGVGDRLIMPGFIPEPLPAIAAADIVLSCARNEAFGRVVVEAMLLGRPIVYARSGGVVEYMEDDRTGLAYTPGNVDELVRCIEQIIDDRPRAASMGDLARDTARQRFSRDAYGGEVFRLFNRLRTKEMPAVDVPRSISMVMARAIGEYGSQLVERNEEIAGLWSRLAASDAALQQRVTEVGDLQIRVAAGEALQAQRDVENKDLRSRLAAGEALLAQRNAAVADLQTRFNALGAHAADLRASVSALTGSTSWRVTAPLRMARKILDQARQQLRKLGIRAFHYLSPRTTAVIRGTPVQVRRGTPDHEVAAMSLGGEFDALHQFLPEPRFNLIIDAGGYIGTAAIALSKLYPTCKVVTLEPSKANFAMLQRNVRDFPQIVPIRKALAGTSRTTLLRKRETGAVGYTLVEHPLDCPAAEPVHACSTITIPELLELYGAAGGIDILKLDIEGGEKEVLDASSNWLDKIDLVVAELHDRITPGCTAAFEKATGGMLRSAGLEKEIAYRHDRQARISAVAGSK